MTDRAALLNAIHLTPGCDTARLVYADWLEENGEPERAEFIRVQVERAWGDSELAADWRDDEGRLAGQCGVWLTCGIGLADDYTWNGNGGDGICVVTRPGVELVWRRGFIATVRGPLALLREHLPLIVTDHPVEWVEATCREPMRWDDDGPGEPPGIQTTYHYINTLNEDGSDQTGEWEIPKSFAGICEATPELCNDRLSEQILAEAREKNRQAACAVA